MVNLIPPISFEEAEHLFRKLVTTYRTRALWFMDETQTGELKSPATSSVLNRIAEKCSRTDWVKVKKIQQWLLQNSR